MFDGVQGRDRDYFGRGGGLGLCSNEDCEKLEEKFPVDVSALMKRYPLADTDDGKYRTDNSLE